MWPFRKPLEPCGGVVGVPTDKQEKLERRLEKAEEELKKLHAATWGDKCVYRDNMIVKYNGETNEFTFGSYSNSMWKYSTPLLPPVSQEEAMELAEFILDNYKGGNK